MRMNGKNIFQGHSCLWLELPFRTGYQLALAVP